MILCYGCIDIFFFSAVGEGLTVSERLYGVKRVNNVRRKKIVAKRRRRPKVNKKKKKCFIRRFHAV